MVIYVYSNKIKEMLILFKKIFISLIYLLVLIIFILAFKNALNKHKYILSGLDEIIKYNCILVMNVENKLYDYDNVKSFESNYSSDNIITTNQIKVTNDEIKYCNYAITIDQDYIFTYIDNKKSIFKIQSPLSEDSRTFLLNSFFKNGVTDITVYPFKDTNKLCVQVERAYYFVDLLSKSIKPLNGGRFAILQVNLKENVIIIIKKDILEGYTYVFDDNGEFICKFL